jgi:hypothetical protein
MMCSIQSGDRCYTRRNSENTIVPMFSNEKAIASVFAKVGDRTMACTVQRMGRKSMQIATVRPIFSEK